MNKLGNWALIDIETTGIDPTYDKIIDLGYLQFEGTKLVKKFSSLVRTDVELSQFIKKLTGINQDMVNKAPRWEEVEPDLIELEGHRLIAHNAGFEDMFLNKYFENHSHGGERETYEDTLFLLGLLNPGRNSLNLESFIVEFKIADKEMHRGYEDSLDLLKVILMSSFILKQDTYKDALYRQIIGNYFAGTKQETFWLLNFLDLKTDELIEIADEVDFDLIGACEKFLALKTEKEEEHSVKLPPADLTFSGTNISDIIKDEERIQQILPHYRFREAQETLAKRVGQSFQNGVHALIQAPTGTGKTLGYLLPAALFSLERDEKVLVATGTKTLQAQAFQKDVPQMRRILGITEDDIKVTPLVGSSNHYCELMYRNILMEEEGLLSSLRPFGESYSKAYMDIVFQLNERQVYKDKITRQNSPYILKHHIKEFGDLDKDLAVDFRACTSSKCPYKTNCSYIQGLREANESDIIIGNHSLMLMWPKGIPSPNYIVVDEAHRLEAEATSMYSYSASQKQLEAFHKNLVTSQGIGALFYLLAGEDNSDAMITNIKKEAAGTAEMIEMHQTELPDQMESLFKKMPRYTSIYWNERPAPKDGDNSDALLVNISNHFKSLQFIYENFYGYLSPHLSRFDVKDMTDDQKIMAYSRFESFMASLEDIVNALNCIVKYEAGYTHSMKYKEKEGYELASSPIDVGKTIHKNILEEAASVVFTSATLANSSGTIATQGVEWMTGYTYINDGRRFKSGLFLPPTFDYKTQTQVHICSDVVSMHQQEFVPSILKKIIPTIKKLDGKTLLLFSSKVRFEIAREVLLKEFEGKLPVFVQGMGNNVVDDFKEAGNGILLGMESFGEGIDVPGEALQFLVIDKIPDIRMDLVIQERRRFYESSFGNEFNDYFLANRTRSLHQKLGRLIRSESDFGGAIIVDSRIARWKGGTLRTFKNMMDPYDIQFSPLEKATEAIESFLEKFS